MSFSPRTIRIHPFDNVAVVVNDGGLPAGTPLPDGPTLVQHVRRLQQDHGWIEEDWLELRPQLQAVVDGINGYDLAFLRAAVPVFTELYRDHIALEESVVYPESRRLQA